MAIKELYSEFCKTPFPRDISENENLADILHDLRMYDDYMAATIDKYLPGVKIDSSELVYDNTIEIKLNEFMSDANNLEEDVSAAKQYLLYVLLLIFSSKLWIREFICSHLISIHKKVV